MQYEWTKSSGIADFVLREKPDEPKATRDYVVPPPFGYVMRSGLTTYIAWIPNDAGNRMEFFDVETAKAWVFAQVRIN